jgi:hypothetical protein
MMAAVEYQPPHEDVSGPACKRHGVVVGPFKASDQYGSPVWRWQCPYCGGQWDLAKAKVKA